MRAYVEEVTHLLTCPKNPPPPPPLAAPSHLPPVGVLLVHYLENVSLGEGQAGLLTGDQVVCGRIIAEVWLQIDLRFIECEQDK